MELSPLKLLIIAILVLVLFGRGRVSEMMGDFGKGIKEFKKGMTEEQDASAKPAAQIPQVAQPTTPPPAQPAASEHHGPTGAA